MGVLVDLVWSARKHLQISGHMDKNKSDQEKARQRNDPLPANRGSEHRKNAVLHKG
jgi:hypothetical protein